MKILAIIITYNSEQWIRKNLESVFQNTEDVFVDVLVVDNHSTDKTLEIIKKEFPQVKIISSPENLGFAKANNLGFEIVKRENYDFAFLMNHDGWLFPDFWKNVVKVLENATYSRFGLLSPIHFDATEKKLDFGFRKYADDSFLNQVNGDVAEIDFINGAFLFISQKCLEAVKGFDQIFFFYGEDIDLCLRAKKKGFKIGLIKNAKVVHDRSERPMTRERLSRHLYANSILQIKGSQSSGFLEVFSKCLFSNVILMFKKNPSLGFIPILHFKNIIRLLRNYAEIKESFYLY